MCPIVDRENEGGVLSDAGLKLFGSSFLGPCKLRELDLTGQMGFCHGVAALAGGRFPGFVFTTTPPARLCSDSWDSQVAMGMHSCPAAAVEPAVLDNRVLGARG